ncbi:MAG: radical SAM protein [Endomicrobiales bacterium]|jgi:radical SAM superfamily enzyme YgiQ (UPF0313 family)
MKIALMLPPMTLEERYGKAIAKVAGTFPPLGLISLGTVLKHAGHDAFVLDGSRMDYARMREILLERKPDILGISGMTFVWSKVRTIMADIKKELPGICIIMGGAHATMYAEKCFADSEHLDIIVYGEGETTIIELVDAIENHKDKEPINGILYRDKGTLHRTPPRDIISDIDTLPIPDRSLVTIADYVPAFSQYRKLPVTNMFTTRGCPSRCRFCFPDVLGRKVRFRSPASVIEEIIYLQNTYHIREIAFWDDTFTVNRQRVLEICRLIKGLKTPITWSAQARVDRIDAELLKAMSDAGCWKLHFGLESMVQKNLDFLLKGTTVEQNRRAVIMTKESGIEVEASFILGTPGETYADGLKTIETARSLNIDFARFFPLTPYGKLHQELQGSGTFITEDWDKYQGNCIVFVPHSMTQAELEKLLSLAYTKFYFRPGFIFKRLKKIMNPAAFAANWRGAKAVYLLARKGFRS